MQWTRCPLRLPPFPAACPPPHPPSRPAPSDSKQLKKHMCACGCDMATCLHVLHHRGEVSLTRSLTLSRYLFLQNAPAGGPSQVTDEKAQILPQL